MSSKHIQRHMHVLERSTLPRYTGPNLGHFLWSGGMNAIRNHSLTFLFIHAYGEGKSNMCVAAWLMITASQCAQGLILLRSIVPLDSIQV